MAQGIGVPSQSESFCIKLSISENNIPRLTNVFSTLSCLYFRGQSTCMKCILSFARAVFNILLQRLSLRLNTREGKYVVQQTLSCLHIKLQTITDGRLHCLYCSHLINLGKCLLVQTSGAPPLLLLLLSGL